MFGEMTKMQYLILRLREIDRDRKKNLITATERMSLKKKLMKLLKEI